jgi:Cu(I)/Ag(I) efflux system membrane fusion protein
MKNALFSFLLLAVLGTGFLAGAWYNQRESASAASLHARTVLYYVDPMHPTYRSDKPGVAPDCGMQLVPVYDEGSQHPASAAAATNVAAGAINVGLDKQQLIGVRAVAVERTTGTERLRLYGRVAADETRSYRIDVGIDGFIREISAVTTGSRVKNGQWLATFSAPEMRSPIQAFLVALDVLDRSKKAGDGPAQIDFANASVQQNIDRLLTLGVSSMQLEEIRQRRQIPPNIKITAPAEGFVLARNVSLGQKFDRGDELYRIADLRRVWILADVFGPEAEHVRPATNVRVSIPGRNTSLIARVSTAVLPQFDPVSQAIRLRLEADNPGYLLRPDMFVDVELPIALPAGIAVPIDAVLDSGLTKTVFVERRPGVFEPRQVETGWRFNDRIEIVKGLVGGERVVVSGAFLLDSETRIRRAQPDTGSTR